MFVGGLLPVLGLLPFAFQSYSTVADHYLYLPMVGLAWAILGTAFLDRRLPITGFTRGLVAGIVLAFGALTWRQVAYWEDTQTLFRHTLAVNPSSYVSAYALGEDFYYRQRLDDAVRYYRLAGEIDPSALDPKQAIGSVYLSQQRYAEAASHYETVVKAGLKLGGSRTHRVAEVYVNYATAVGELGRTDRSIELFSKADSLEPGLAVVKQNLGVLNLKLGRTQEAIAYFREALASNPGDASTRQRLNEALQQARTPPKP
jgi:tetratricopeptide (TPR) repeat protein